MRRILYFLCIVILLLTGCTKEKDNFKHYNLNDEDINTYIYHSDVRGKEEYALSDLTTEDMTITTGFFYKITDNDYILLNTLESSKKDAYSNKEAYQFYDNKLYGVGNGDTPMYFEIELNGKDSYLEEKKFTYNEKNVGPVSIKKIENNYIIFYGYTSTKDEAILRKYFKCSLNDYKCQIQENY